VRRIPPDCGSAPTAVNRSEGAKGPSVGRRRAGVPDPTSTRPETPHELPVGSRCAPGGGCAQGGGCYGDCDCLVGDSLDPTDSSRPSSSRYPLSTGSPLREANAAPRAEADLPLSRRTLLGRAAVASTVLLVPAAFSAAAEAWRVPTKRRAVWGLSAAADHGGASCSACRACTGHAENKLFASARSADVGRAHPGCGCAVVRAGSVSTATWRGLFLHSDGSRRAHVDRRTARVRRLLHPVRHTAVA
jgi:hypothetical protein